MAEKGQLVRKMAGTNIAIQNQWLRTTQNPVASRYPKSGQFIKMSGHGFISDGWYLVVMVVEYEPAFIEDEDGRDIRLRILSGGFDSEEFSARTINKHLLKIADEIEE